MARIHIRHAHPLAHQKARKVVSDIAQTLGRKFGVTSHWEEDVLHFSRPGIDGSIALLPGEVELTATLGVLFSAMKPTVEKEILRVLKEKF